MVMPGHIVSMIMTEASRSGALRFFDRDEVAAALPWNETIAAIEQVLADPNAHAPERSVHQVPVPDSADASILLKPGWVIGDVIAVKVVTFFPDNGAKDLPTINAGVLLFDATTGVMLGACDGNELTTRRTAAASAVAAKRLARDDASRLLVVGTGALAPHTAEAHAAVRSYETIDVWGRDPDKARIVANALIAVGLPAQAVEDVDAAVSEADVITAVTGAKHPLVKGSLVRPGTHIDLVGAFTAEMRESDDQLVESASVFVDTRAGAVIAGDLAQPLASGLITESDINADLRELVTGEHPGRSDTDEITLFKSAGIALEDVAAARLVFAD